VNITKLELLTADLQAQQDFYANILELPSKLTTSGLEVKPGNTELLFTQAPLDFDGAYHFAFNIPGNQFQRAKQWISARLLLLPDEKGQDEFQFESWNSESVYFKDPAGNVLEFIARHNLEEAGEGEFNSRQILNISEIGLPSEDVLTLTDQLCRQLGLSVFKQEPNEIFTPVGDDNGLLIVPVQGRIWIPNSGVPAKLLPVTVKGNTNGQEWEVRGVPYEILNSR
jgi:catechol 2,3-dioxygenase-like lactoylglutathione lyase family enzyme